MLQRQVEDISVERRRALEVSDDQIDRTDLLLPSSNLTPSLHIACRAVSPSDGWLMRDSWLRGHFGTLPRRAFAYRGPRVRIADPSLSALLGPMGRFGPSQYVVNR